MDVYETQDALSVTIELAGVAEGEVEVSLHDNALIIEGRRALPPAEGNGVLHVMQIHQGPFRAEVPLSNPIDADHVTARFGQGLLQVSLPRRKG
jgi:HSP20 family protein